jgi:DNA-binding IclR family transcriptional regulator
MTEAKGQKMIQSVERAAAILRCFETREELGLAELADRLGLHKSTVFGLVNTLRKEKLLQQNEETGRLRLGLALFRLGASVSLDLKNLCGPYLEQLLRDTSETVNLVVRDDDHVVYLEKKESPHSMRICTRIGQRLPLYCTGTGKAILAFLRPEERQPLLAHMQFTPYTVHTMLTPAALEQQLEQIRAEGCAYDLEELEYGLVCVAAPLLDGKNRPLGGLSIAGPSVRMDAARRQAFKNLLLETTARIRRELQG